MHEHWQQYVAHGDRCTDSDGIRPDRHRTIHRRRTQQHSPDQQQQRTEQCPPPGLSDDTMIGDVWFDTIFFGSLERIMNVVPIDATDLADWAVRLYDEYLRRPDLIRLATWARMERRPSGHLVDQDERLDDAKLRAIADAQAAGLVRDGDPFDLMAMVIAMSMAWSPVSNVYAATADEPPDVHERRRALLRDCVAQAIALE
ncbi:hypothetical protein [Phytoactinopolyspora halophila]|uniref:hypothetical protein n=1 Tax=Phytoactinopolyspora halophila TaxID=1981511 RepID=UPI001B8B6222|nr:hypothetical protein [Phytoactinopolyspora halophila]